MIRALILYVEAGALVGLGAGLYGLLERRALPSLAAAPERALRFAAVLIAAALALPALWGALAAAPVGPAVPIQIWSGSARGVEAAVSVSLSPGAGAAARTWALPRGLPLLLALALAGGALVRLGQLWRQARALGRFCRALPVVRRIGAVTLAAADTGMTPFAARAGGRAYIVLPTALWTDPARVRLVVAHEAHHHRRGDLLAARALAVLAALFFWNPAVALWQRRLARLQELACDRFVIQRRGAGARDYARCLLWAAELALAPRFRLVSSMAATPAVFLRRRIEMLLPHPAGRPRSHVLPALLAGTLAAVTATSFLAHGAVGDRRVSREQAEAIAARAGDLPVIVDDAFLKELNGAVATPSGRELRRRALERLPTYRTMIEATLVSRSLPRELLAVAMAESAFNNDARPTNPPPERRGAGIWQMIPGSARAFGLRVDDAVDERLDPRRQTEAAATYLSSLHVRYGDWLVALAAYSRGEKAMDKLLAEAGTRDGKALYQSGRLGHYVTEIMVAVLLLREPSLVQ